MALQGETIASGAPTTCDCGWQVELSVCQSAAGYYVGAQCPNCGPYSRESDYYATRDQAAEALAANDFGRVYDYVPGGLSLVMFGEDDYSFWDDYDSDDELYYEVEQEDSTPLEHDFFHELAVQLINGGYFSNEEIEVLAQIGQELED